MLLCDFVNIIPQEFQIFLKLHLQYQKMPSHTGHSAGIKTTHSLDLSTIVFLTPKPRIQIECDVDFLVCARQGNIIFRYKIPQIPLTTNNSTIVYKTIGTAHLVLPAIKLEYLLGKYLSTSFTDILLRHYNSDFLDIKQNHQMSRPIIQQTIILNICVRFLKFRPFMKR